MKRFLILPAVTVAALGLSGCGEDQKTAEKPKDIGYVAPPELPQADPGKSGDQPKTPPK